MTLNNLFSKLKGGAGSGNLGHAGRPGHHGGSAPASFLVPDSAEEIETFLSKGRNPGVLGMVPAFYDSRNKKLYVSRNNVSHSTLSSDISSSDPIGIEDSSIHILIYVKNNFKIEKLVFDTKQAGSQVKSEEKTIDSIYKTMDILKNKYKLSQGTEVIIKTNKGKIDTTL